ncbi:MAG TPA: response regulator [Verrucomicrobiae bacterium]|jgi:signal transduction histidine kinase
MKKILVIDDEEWLREMIHLALQQRGFQIIEAANGADGIEMARKELPDLILCDINMGKVDGYLTLSSLRNEAPTAAIPFILMTGLADNAGMRHGMELGADDYLPKPFTTDGLYAAVNARLKKAQTIRDEAERKLAHLRDNISLMMPHEMRTPLNGILSNAEVLAHSAMTLKPGDVAEIGQEIHKSSERLARLIENFLIYAQLELVAADPKNVNALRVGQTKHPKALIKNHAAAQAAHANRLPDLSFELADIPLPIAEEYLSKITNELLQNAFKFSEADSPVRVTLDEAPQGGAVTLSVSDSGRGFTAEQITRIGAYMQFDRKLHEQQGLGLGLTIAKRLVELHGGKFSIVSDKESGTVISAKFPKTKAE